MAPAGSVDPGTEEEPELTDEELDAVADVGSEVITAVLQKFGIDATVEEYEGDEGELILDIVGDDLAVLIGRHGRTLDALQVLVSAATNRRLERRYPVTIDISGYRHRRRLKIEEIARRAADRASRQHRPVSMRPMSGLERRMVHIALRGDRRVTTESEGQEPNRCVVVHPH
jgi:spoIIIJ-associated protein